MEGFFVDADSVDTESEAVDPAATAGVTAGVSVVVVVSKVAGKGTTASTSLSSFTHSSTILINMSTCSIVL